jgi:hypothetical protein
MRGHIRRILFGVLSPLVALGVVACSEPTVFLGSNGVPDSCSLAPVVPPASLGLDAFYQKYVDANGIPVVSSVNVADAALRQACIITTHMTRKRDDVRQAMIARDLRVAVIGVTEVTLDIPEYSDLPSNSEHHWNQERGEPASAARPVCSVGEENLLCLTDDPFAGAAILVDTLAYAIKDFGLSVVKPDFDARLTAAYESATSAGLWQNTLTARVASFYFPGGVMDWYDADLEADPADGVYNFVNTRAELEAYDPTLAGLIAEQFVVDDWRPGCP